MRLRVLQGILGVLVVIFLYSTTREPVGIAPPPPPRRPWKAQGTAPAASGVAEGRAPKRNLFEYGETYVPAPVVSYVTPMATPVEAPAATATPFPVKLVGLVQQAGGLRAALAIDGEIVLGAQGQHVGGYKIVSIDEDRGVVLKGPDEQTVELRPAETP